MKTTKSLLILGIALTTVLSCSKDDSETQNPVIPTAQGVDQPAARQLECSYVDAYWSSTAYLSTTIGTTAETSFMNTQNSKIAAVWGRPAVTLRFVKDPSNPSSTFNAISYSSKKIYIRRAADGCAGDWRSSANSSF